MLSLHIRFYLALFLNPNFVNKQTVGTLYTDNLRWCRLLPQMVDQAYID